MDNDEKNKIFEPKTRTPSRSRKVRVRKVKEGVDSLAGASELRSEDYEDAFGS